MAGAKGPAGRFWWLEQGVPALRLYYANRDFPCVQSDGECVCPGAGWKTPLESHRPIDCLSNQSIGFPRMYRRSKMQRFRRTVSAGSIATELDAKRVVFWWIRPDIFGALRA